jgi:hypothetical protein
MWFLISKMNPNYSDTPAGCDVVADPEAEGGEALKFKSAVERGDTRITKMLTDAGGKCKRDWREKQMVLLSHGQWSSRQRR